MMDSERVASISSATGAHQPSKSLDNFGPCSEGGSGIPGGSLAVAHQPVRPSPTGPTPKRRPSP
jgi:hypothetical protein